MALPVQVQNAFREGRALAAEIASPRAGWRAWVYVEPSMRGGKTYAEVLQEWTASREAGAAYDPAVAGYTIRYVELSDWHLSEEWYFDLDIAIRQRPIVDITIEVANDTELEGEITKWLDDVSLLRSPSAVDYPDPPPAASPQSLT